MHEERWGWCMRWVGLVHEGGWADAGYGHLGAGCKG